jgi:hypothetical protein
MVLTACNLENQASDHGIDPGKSYGSRGNTLPVNVISAHACCETRPPAGNYGGADWAVDGDTSHWWHSNYNAGTEGYSVDTSETGHIGDFDNYLIRGDGEHLDGYTWTRDPALALGGPEYPVAVETAVPPYGAHWITLDLGTDVEINADTLGRLAYYRWTNLIDGVDQATGGLGQPGVSYEIYVSKKDFGWLVDSPEVTLLKQEDEAEDPLPNTGGYSYIYLESETPLSFRYIQIRWVFDSSTTAADAKTASAANIIFKIFGRDLDYSYLVASYTRGMALLGTLPSTGHEYNRLRIALVAVQNLFEPPEETGVDTQEKRTAYQDVLDGAADALLMAIYEIDPPKEPPEVQL